VPSTKPWSELRAHMGAREAAIAREREKALDEIAEYENALDREDDRTEEAADNSTSSDCS